MVIDGSKGVERQTIKLFKVCMMRHIPVFTFVNKMDREARNPFDLLEEIEQVLGINTYAVNWPIGSGRDFKGVYQREEKKILQFTAADNGRHEVASEEVDLADSDRLQEMLGEDLYQTLVDDVELLDGAGAEFDLDEVSAGRLSPVFFGSALTNFGVEPFLKDFLRMTSSPLARATADDIIDPFDPDFSAFVFKIQANMNKAHRDRIAFMRICSGKFEKGMEVMHVQGNRKMKLSQPQQMMAEERQIIDEAYAGDIIGVFDPGVFSIGDTVCAPSRKIKFEGIPTFAPEHFSLVSPMDTMKRKQFVKGMEQIAQEGAIQIFRPLGGGMEEVIVGVVGTLQFDVLVYRLKNEYGVDLRMQGLPYSHIRWIENEDIDPRRLQLSSDTRRIEDLKGNKLLLFTSPWNIDWALDHNDGLELAEFSRN
jgi:peptide chain release factor 3